ncbi:hypothetical protein [Aurantiacibacter odishensis]|uniref:hypothetical protein n=1 Tax=Aurantiacibacter odishensis TaxID=1155476 RepID=UPI0013C449AA|nr:hypothetical protein [Aurantiacibacter odishensis]
MPPFEEISSANLAYARCIDEAVKSLGVPSQPVGSDVAAVREQCSDARAHALRMRVVPVFAESIEAYDEIHDGLARSLLEDRNRETVQ